MRIGVIGAGGMGGALAALLDSAGHDVVVTARGAHLTAIRESGLRMTGAWGEHAAPVAAAETLPDDDGFDLVVLATKAQDADRALAASRGAVEGAALLVLQNGVDGRAAAARLAPEATAVLGGISSYGANVAAPGVIEVTTPGPLRIGPLPDGTRGEGIRAALADAVPVVVEADIRGAEWTKLLVNHVNAMPAITGRSIQDTLADPTLARWITTSMREAIDVARALGVRFADVQGLDARRLALVRMLPLALAVRIPQRIGIRMGPVPNTGSTLQSITRGLPTEIDYLNGAVVREGARVGVPTPVSTRIVELVHEIERGRPFLSVGEVDQQLSL